MNAQAKHTRNRIHLPYPPPPGGHYEPVVTNDSLLFIAGQFPVVDDRLVYRGRLGETIDTAAGYDAARLCAVNALAQIQRALTSFDAVIGLARVEGYLQTAESYREHAKVLDGASDLFYEVLGARGTHTRAVFGVASLPLDAPIELVVTARISPPRAWLWRRLLNSNRTKGMRSFDVNSPKGRSGVGRASPPKTAAG